MSGVTRYPTDRSSLEKVCDVEFVRASGPGGQHRNKRSTGVRLTHKPTGLVMYCTERRSQQRNLDAAYDRLAARLEERQRPRKRRRPTRPTRGSQERRLKSKRHAGEKKASRRRPGHE